MQISELVEVEHLSEVSGCALPPCLVISSHIKGKSSISIAKTGEGAPILGRKENMSTRHSELCDVFDFLF